MSNPSLRLVLWKLLVLYLNFLLGQQLGSQLKFQARAQAKLSDKEVSALDTIRDQWKLTGLSPDNYCSVSNQKPGDGVSIAITITITCDCRYNNNTVCHVRDIYGYSVGLTGVIPNEVGEFEYMSRLDLSSNQLTGSIPYTLGRAKSLRFLYLGYNLLVETIPPSLGSLVDLQVLSLRFNKLSGLMPDIFENLANLVTLDIANNRFRGPLPETLGNLKSFTGFWAIGNSFSGPIPKTYENLINLEYFLMCGNDLSGPLPVSIMKHWSKIWDLSLQGNNFRGDTQSMKEILNFPNLLYLKITDLGRNSSIELPSEITNKKYRLLTLRNCSITGPIPKYIGQMTDLKFLDLSFNSLTGGLPDMGSGPDYMSFSSNKLSGTIPEWVFQPVKTEIDLSFNHFSATDSPTPENRDVNLFACCETSPDTYPYRWDPFKMVDRYCQGNKQKYNSLFINCGGGEKIVNGITYEQDNDTARFFTSPKQNWAYSSSGDYWKANVSASDYIRNMSCGVSVDDAPLYDRARLSPVSLKYYAFCLREGNYTVSLKFAEIVYSKNEDYTSLRKRAFTIYIQDDKNNALYDFDIAVKAGGPDKPFTKNFTAVVNKTNTLSIHMYWRGKGSFIHLGPGLYGPLISAISVTPDYKIHDEKKVPSLHIALIVIGSTILLVLLLLGFAWKIRQRWKYSSKIKVGEEKDVPLRELIAATGRFSKKEIIGRGNHGKVYTAKLQGPNKTTYTVAVKKLSSRNFKENIQNLKKEIKLLYELSHENLIKLFDYHIDRDLQLLVYEYMENGSLEDALTVDSNSRSLKFDWDSRYNICLGIARGLQYLHEHRKLNIAHMNIKAVNILLDGDLQPKISDFGFSHLFVDENQLKAIKREVTQGYMAPEYFQGNLTMKSDVYSFGVILLEIVSWKKNVTSTNHGAEVLVNTANEKYERGTLRDMIDQTLEGCNTQQALTILKLAVKCTSIAPSVRPSISDVVSVLSGKKKIEDLSRSAAPNAVEKNLEEAPHVAEKIEGTPNVGEESEGTPNVGEKTKDIEEGPSTNFRRQQTAYYDSLGATSMKR